MTNASKTIDWAQIKSGLEQWRRALDNPLEGRELSTIYRRRARQLAQRRDAAAPTAAGIPALVFNLGEETFALELRQLQEIFPYEKITAVPTAPPEILGVFNLRDDIRCVMDLGALIQLPGGTTHGKDDNGYKGYILVLKNNRTGFRVDHISEIVHFSETPEPETKDGPSPLPTRYTKRLIKGNTALLDVEKILAHPLLQSIPIAEGA